MDMFSELTPQPYPCPTLNTRGTVMVGVLFFLRLTFEMFNYSGIQWASEPTGYWY